MQRGRSDARERNTRLPLEQESLTPVAEGANRFRMPTDRRNSRPDGGAEDDFEGENQVTVLYKFLKAIEDFGFQGGKFFRRESSEQRTGGDGDF